MPCYNDIKLNIEKGADFSQVFRWKDKYKEPIDISTYNFRCQFRFNFGSDNIFCTLPDEELGTSITVDNTLGQITLYIPASITSNLKGYDDGLWSLEYNNVNSTYKTLISGRWSVTNEITV